METKQIRRKAKASPMGVLCVGGGDNGTFLEMCLSIESTYYVVGRHKPSSAYLKHKLQGFLFKSSFTGKLGRGPVTACYGNRVANIFCSVKTRKPL